MMIHRVQLFLYELRKKHYMKDIIIFTHCGVIESIKIINGTINPTEAFTNPPKYGDIVDFYI